MEIRIRYTVETDEGRLLSLVLKADDVGKMDWGPLCEAFHADSRRLLTSLLKTADCVLRFGGPLPEETQAEWVERVLPEEATLYGGAVEIVELQGPGLAG